MVYGKSPSRNGWSLGVPLFQETTICNTKEFGIWTELGGLAATLRPFYFTPLRPELGQSILSWYSLEKKTYRNNVGGCWGLESKQTSVQPSETTKYQGLAIACHGLVWMFRQEGHAGGPILRAQWAEPPVVFNLIQQWIISYLCNRM